MRNLYGGTCYRCGTRVEAGDGHFERQHGADGKWRTQHASCAIVWRRGPAPTTAEALQARQAFLARTQRRPRA